MLIDLRRLKRDSTRVLHSLPPDIHASQSSLHIGAPTHIPSGKPRISRGVALGIAGVLVAVVAVIVMILPRGDQSSSQLSDQRRAVVAVLPFENLGLPEQEYFADGVTEEITSRLSGLSGLGVIARSSAMQYKRTTKTLRQIGEELSVGYVLQGTIRWSTIPDGGSRVRINPALVRVSDATQIWSQSYEAVLSDVFKLQSEIAAQVAGALGVKLLQPEQKALEARPRRGSR
jgi:TolB-like protein